jgi:hypothetical protein
MHSIRCDSIPSNPPSNTSKRWQNVNPKTYEAKPSVYDCAAASGSAGQHSDSISKQRNCPCNIPGVVQIIHRVMQRTNRHKNNNWWNRAQPSHRRLWYHPPFMDCHHTRQSQSPSKTKRTAVSIRDSRSCSGGRCSSSDRSVQNDIIDILMALGMRFVLTSSMP